MRSQHAQIVCRWPCSLRARSRLIPRHDDVTIHNSILTVGTYAASIFLPRSLFARFFGSRPCRMLAAGRSTTACRSRTTTSLRRRTIKLGVLIADIVTNSLFKGTMVPASEVPRPHTIRTHRVYGKYKDFNC